MNVLEDCVCSLHQANRYNVFLKKTCSDPNFYYGLVSQDLKSQLFIFFFPQRKRLIQSKFILFAMKFRVQKPDHATE